MSVNNKFFHIDMLPAGGGDSLLIEYGDPIAPHRILIDGGRISAYDAVKTRIRELPASQHLFELGILTHIDADHITGFLKLLEDEDSSLSFKDFWHNDKKHFKKAPLDLGAEEAASLSVPQGERLAHLLEAKQWPWNRAFNEEPIVVPNPADEPLPVIELVGGMHLTLLSPTWEKMKKMRIKWEKAIREAGLVPGQESEELDEEEEKAQSLGAGGLNTVAEINELANKPFKKDGSAANGSSIAVLVEYEGKRALLTGDAHSDVLEATLPRLPIFNSDGTIDVDVFKVSHHGSAKTLSKGLAKMVNASQYLISTNGAGHGHPDAEAIARIMKFGPKKDKTIVFNYRTSSTNIWDKSHLKGNFQYETCYPADSDEGGIRVKLL